MSTIKQNGLENKSLITKTLETVLKERVENLICLKFDLHHLSKQYPQVLSTDEDIIKINNHLDELRVNNKGPKEKKEIIDLEAKLVNLREMGKQYSKSAEQIEKAEKLIDELQFVIKDPKQLYE